MTQTNEASLSSIELTRLAEAFDEGAQAQANEDGRRWNPSYPVNPYRCQFVVDVNYACRLGRHDDKRHVCRNPEGVEIVVVPWESA